MNVFGDNERVFIFENLDDPGQPYSCEQWGALGEENIPLIVDDGEEHQLHGLFSIDGNFASRALIDYNMVFRNYSYSNSNPSLINIINEILLEMESIPGDINSDYYVDILDIVLLVDYIFNSDYYVEYCDLNEDSILNIQDIILVINIILE